MTSPGRLISMPILNPDHEDIVHSPVGGVVAVVGGGDGCE